MRAFENHQRSFIQFLPHELFPFPSTPFPDATNVQGRGENERNGVSIQRCERVMRCFMEVKLRSACMRKEAIMVLLLPISHVNPHSDAEDHPAPFTQVQASQIHLPAR
ncbi:hypothetical protein FJTKL_10590 [Diaporthe vaccinii]|uniref:Uncharacterized protein n=1 Tax=Diaporthe vaccinii TaxID=105482 RepID=A0ABR4EJ84_9PEZI